ncbi:hypothetical protein FLK61_28015 [Paenalkalicoccus suaedae]|uniref:Uncharacterized protein n=1 Tax=Paenalkalicoccus suaedae TaxID=2592382 RepID=A0A859FCN2_9BACI|nr:hypothetical protein [Paenalkalicoccus suaedae]QKS70598.1 hypothetical protein FLK61_28015 [Paenalkalicoccus suaedae]
MKTYMLAVLAIILVILVAACNREEPEEPTTVSGKLDIVHHDYLQVSIESVAEAAGADEGVYHAVGIYITDDLDIRDPYGQYLSRRALQSATPNETDVTIDLLLSDYLEGNLPYDEFLGLYMVDTKSVIVDL